MISTGPATKPSMEMLHSLVLLVLNAPWSIVYSTLMSSLAFFASLTRFASTTSLIRSNKIGWAILVLFFAIFFCLKSFLSYSHSSLKQNHCYAFNFCGRQEQKDEQMIYSFFVGLFEENTAFPKSRAPQDDPNQSSRLCHGKRGRVSAGRFSRQF